MRIWRYLGMYISWDFLTKNLWGLRNKPQCLCLSTLTDKVSAVSLWELPTVNSVELICTNMPRNHTRMKSKPNSSAKRKSLQTATRFQHTSTKTEMDFRSIDVHFTHLSNLSPVPLSGVWTVYGCWSVHQMLGILQRRLFSFHMLGGVQGLSQSNRNDLSFDFVAVLEGTLLSWLCKSHIKSVSSLQVQILRERVQSHHSHELWCETVHF